MGSKAQHPSMPSARKTAETRIQIIGPGGSVDQGLVETLWSFGGSVPLAATDLFSGHPVWA